ncbi:HAD family phosphatase [Cohnella endophytica]|uniref:HAD family phosphatase n=1 Tax=Cohnella endophytica TaxID=2419778 RepID=A0A494YA80_9BACL|nr:HAD family hydrolase [Cohnella endophytica]RKP56812.1 HAD family phosphatase [Cohnella endophytica]
MDFVFDLDGTICYKGRPVTEKLLKALDSLQSNGHRVIVASARPIRDILPVMDERFHGHTLIGGNGSLISSNGKLIFSEPFSDHQRSTITRLLHEYEATYLIDGEWDYSYTGAQEHPILKNVDPAKLAKMIPLDAHESVVKVLILTASNMEKLSEEIAAVNVEVHNHANENVLDISPNEVHKWNALRKLDIEKGSYIAFGNDANDVSMFMNAKHSVMIGFHDELAKFASETIPNDESIEDRIVDKLNELSAMYRGLSRALT